MIWYKLVTWTLARGGAAWIKWAQWASTRPDILPEALCAQLATLQTQAPAHSFAYTRREVERAFEQPLETVFARFDPEPVASGSIAQVHFARLGDKDVAVKVRHPNVAERLSIDFRIMKRAAELVALVPGLGWLNLKQSVEAFSHTMTGQTWLDIEANHLALFNLNFKDWSDVRFPQPLMATESVLVETFEQGRLVSDFTGLVSEPRQGGAILRLPEDVAHFVVTRGEDLYLKMLLTDGLMHADLHPGNILVEYDPKTGAKDARITLVDAGMVASLKIAEQRNFVGLLVSMGRGDGKAAAQHVLSFSNDQTCVDPVTIAAFSDAMGKFFAEHCRGYGTGIELAGVLRGVLGLVREYSVRIDVNYATLIMNALCLDGLAKALLPDYNVMDAAAPLLRAYGRWGVVTTSGVGKSVLNRLALPLAMVRKRRHDSAVSRRMRRREQRCQIAVSDTTEHQALIAGPERKLALPMK